MSKQLVATPLSDIPILPAYRLGTPGREQSTVWCAHEQVWHYHGVGNGHRVAHCTCSQSPLRATGYWLRDAGPLTDEVRQEHRPARRAFGRCPGCYPSRTRGGAR